MSTYYVGSGGSNANNGTTWALRKLTITAGFALLAAGDTLYIGPGIYRENPSTGVNGSSGSPITVIGDESGMFTDGIGGEIRITGSDNDQTATRTNGITVANSWWVFRGLHLDTTTTNGFNITGGNNIVEYCAGRHIPTFILNSGASALTNTFRHLWGLVSTNGINFTHTSGVDNSGCVAENVFFTGMSAAGIRIVRFGGLTLRNMTLIGLNAGVQCTNSPSAAQVNNVNNSIIAHCAVGFVGVLTTDITEDYNTLFANATARTNTSAGAHSQAYAPQLAMPLLTLGIHVPYIGALSPDSPVASIAGTSVASDDLYGTARPGTASWGAVQYEAGRRPNDSGFSSARRLGAK